eukprot:SAG22_NODE_1713_length_3750_cov_1.552177_5_plen_77_part_00
MAAVCNGMAAHGGLIPYCATFLNFIGYALGAVRISALSRFRVLVSCKALPFCCASTLSFCLRQRLSLPSVCPCSTS